MFSLLITLVIIRLLFVTEWFVVWWNRPMEGAVLYICLSIICDTYEWGLGSYGRGVMEHGGSIMERFGT